MIGEYAIGKLRETKNTQKKEEERKRHERKTA